MVRRGKRLEECYATSEDYLHRFVPLVKTFWREISRHGRARGRLLRPCDGHACDVLRGLCHVCSLLLLLKRRGSEAGAVLGRVGGRGLRRSGQHAIADQFLDLLFRDAQELAQDVAVVLAQAGRRSADGSRRVG